MLLLSLKLYTRQTHRTQTPYLIFEHQMELSLVLYTIQRVLWAMTFAVTPVEVELLQRIVITVHLRSGSGLRQAGFVIVHAKL